MMDSQHPERQLPFANTNEFYAALGMFYAAWSRTDLVIDCAIWKAGTETPTEVHKRVAALKFKDKCKHFRGLLRVSTFENIDEIETLLTLIADHAKRNEFAHSFLASDGDSVAFIYRRSSKKAGYEVTQAKATREQFLQHVDTFLNMSRE